MSEEKVEKKIEKLEEEIVETREERKKRLEVEKWVPKTKAGKMAKNSEISSFDQLFESNLPVIEPEIIDVLLPGLEEKLVDVKKTAVVKRAGRKFFFRATVLVGDKNQYVGIGAGRDKERWPAIRKATRRAKLNLVKVRKGCGSWECTCDTAHSVPFKVVGKCASVRIELLPAPKGTGLVVGKNIKDVMVFAGITDVWSKTRGNTSTALNFVSAAVDALSKTTKMKISKDVEKKAKGK